MNQRVASGRLNLFLLLLCTSALNANQFSAAAHVGEIRASSSVVESLPATKKSVKGWAKCDGSADDAIGLSRAIMAARHGSFTLVVDCPIRFHVGMDIARIIFIDDGTAVEFTGAGKLIVDNVFIPSFVIANSKNIRLINWKVDYDASLPVDFNVGGHTVDGKFVRGEPPGGAFNDTIITPWLAANRSIAFVKSQGYVTALWSGPTNVCAIFFISGDSSNIDVTGMRVTVPAEVGVERFAPVVFSLNPNFKSNQTVTAKTPFVPQYVASPHDLTFSNIYLDGSYMGFVGSAQNAVFDNIHSHRYGDLEGAGGISVGGVGKWFAPPHLFYLSYTPTVDPALYNRNIRITNVIDDGIRIGTARDLGGADTGSGNALSLKLGCVQCIVDNYKTLRPDGFVDVLGSDNLTISNVEATYSSAFLNDIYPGWRFPKPPYKNVRFRNIRLIDTAPTTMHLPIENAADPANEGLEFTNVHVEINHWGGAGALPVPNITGQTKDSSIEFDIKADSSRIKHAQGGRAQVLVQATPSAVRTGASTVLNWSSKGADSCSAKGPWTGSLTPSGSRSVTVAVRGDNDFTVSCQNGGEESQATVRVVAAP